VVDGTVNVDTMLRSNFHKFMLTMTVIVTTFHRASIAKTSPL